jgi:hypothetical protein
LAGRESSVQLGILVGEQLELSGSYGR